MDNRVLFTNKEDCSGCSACLSICPRQAISVCIDNEGFYYPVIEGTTCIKCGLCAKVCPMKN